MSLSDDAWPAPSTAEIPAVNDGDDASFDETEVRTLIDALAAEGPVSSDPVGGPLPRSSAHEAGELDDSVTMQAPSVSAMKDARLPEDEAVNVARSLPAAGRRPGEALVQDFSPWDDPDAYDADESVTTRGPLIDPDEEPDSVTTQAPAHLTDELRVIARPSGVGLEGEAPSQNATVAMLGAPVKPMNALSSAGSLRGVLTAPGSTVPPQDHGSGSRPAHGGIHGNREAGPIAFGSSAQDFRAHDIPPNQHEIDANQVGPKTRYGLLVALVAVVSFAIPLLLFWWLYQGSTDEIPPRAASEVAPDLVGRGDSVRSKATKPPPAPHAPGGRRTFPRRR